MLQLTAGLVTQAKEMFSANLHVTTLNEPCLESYVENQWACQWPLPQRIREFTDNYFVILYSAFRRHDFLLKVMSPLLRKGKRKSNGAKQSLFSELQNSLSSP
jgi:hypothetical protein